MSGEFAAQRVGSARLDQEHRPLVFSIYGSVLQVVLQPREMLQRSGYEKWQGGGVHETLPILFIC